MSRVGSVLDLGLCYWQSVELFGPTSSGTTDLAAGSAAEIAVLGDLIHRQVLVSLISMAKNILSLRQQAAMVVVEVL